MSTTPIPSPVFPSMDATLRQFFAANRFPYNLQTRLIEQADDTEYNMQSAALLAFGLMNLDGTPIANGSIASWDSTVIYESGDRVEGSDGNIYQAVSQTFQMDPVSNDGGDWTLLFLRSGNLTLNIPSRFPNLTAAWGFIARAIIPGAFTVTIQFADGTYAMGSTRFNFNHPFGSQIRLQGNTSTPGNCVLDWSSAVITLTGFFTRTFGVFNVTDGHTINIAGFKMVGPTNAQYGITGILAFNGATAICPNMWVRNFYCEVAAVNGSYIECDGIHVENGGDGNLFVYNGSKMSAQGCLSEGASVWFAKSGAMVEHGSALFAPNSTFKNNTGSQAACHFGSTLMLTGSSFIAEGGLIGSVNGVRMLCSDNCDLAGCTYTGVSAPAAEIINRDVPGQTAAIILGIAHSPAGSISHLTGQGIVSTLALVQNNIGTVWLGTPASVAKGIVGTDCTEVNIRYGTNAALTGGSLGAVFSAKGFQPPQLASDPASPAEGFIWYNTTSHTLKYRDNSGTKTITAS